MYENTLALAGLTSDQAAIYEVLLKNGPLTARGIAQNSPYKRSLVYKYLEDLQTLGLVSRKDEVGKVSVFEPAHPLRLKELAEKKQEQARTAQTALEGILGQLTSDFNLISGKPGVRFFEGLEGIKKVLVDTLAGNPERELLTFSDVAGYARYLRQWNTEYYAPQRKKLGIREKVIIPNNPEAVEYMKNYKANEITEILFLDHALYPFQTEINIYSNKISFVTFSDKTHIGAIIENKEIYTTLASIFRFTWEMGKKYGLDIQPQWLQKQIKDPEENKQTTPQPEPPPATRLA